jgi:O-antigen/teichoic acid export membrane protein
MEDVNSGRHPQRIRSRTTVGATLLIATRLVTRCIDFTALAILGRLLSPADFGLVAIAMSVVMIVESVMELPVGLALVAFPVRTKAHFDTAFTLQMMRGGLLAAILLVAAWPLSQIYNDTRLSSLICALAIAPASRGLSSPRVAEYVMTFDFRPNFVMEVLGKLAACVLSVGIAWWTKSYWSLAVSSIATPVTMAVISFIYAPYLPNISLREWRQFSGFLGWSTATQAVTAANWQIDQLLLGKFVSRFDLGRFSMASNLSSMPWQIFVVQVTNPLLVAFSLVRQDAGRLAAAFHRSSNTIVGIGLPALLGMFAVAEPLLRVILGDQWSGAAPVLAWLALAGIPSLFYAPLNPLLMALNKTNVFFRLRLAEFLFKIPLMIFGTRYYGVTGAVVVRLLTELFLAGYSMLLVRELIRLPIWAQLLGAWRPVFSAIVMAVLVVALSERFLKVQDHIQLMLGLASVVFVGALVYTGSMLLLWRLAGRPDGLETNFTRFLVGRLPKFGGVTRDR